MDHKIDYTSTYGATEDAKLTTRIEAAEEKKIKLE